MLQREMTKNLGHSGAKLDNLLVSTVLERQKIISDAEGSLEESSPLNFHMIRSFFWSAARFQAADSDT